MTGNSPTITTASREFLPRCGWHASEPAPTEQDCEVATVDKSDSSRRTAQLVHCKLVVGACQLSTVLQVVERLDSPDHCVLTNWHIHVGDKDFEDIQRNAWDADMCYLAANPEQGDKMQQGILQPFVSKIASKTPVCLPVHICCLLNW